MNGVFTTKAPPWKYTMTARFSFGSVILGRNRRAVMLDSGTTTISFDETPVMGSDKIFGSWSLYMAIFVNSETHW